MERPRPPRVGGTRALFLGLSQAAAQLTFLFYSEPVWVFPSPVFFLSVAPVPAYQFFWLEPCPMCSVCVFCSSNQEKEAQMTDDGVVVLKKKANKQTTTKLSRYFGHVTVVDRWNRKGFLENQ